MEAAPKVGDVYCQENAPGVAQDAAEVLSVTASRSVPYGSFSGNVLQTKDYSLIEPKNENKFYALGVGTVEAISTTGPGEDIQLFEVEAACVAPSRANASVRVEVGNQAADDLCYLPTV
jgi:hypothetical protein